MNRCRETAGVLFHKRCHYEATQACQSCNKPICRAHVRRFEAMEVCVTCARQWLSNPQYRNSQQHLRDDPYFYWYYHSSYHDPYGAEDYALFDQVEGNMSYGDVESQWEGT